MPIQRLPLIAGFVIATLIFLVDGIRFPAYSQQQLPYLYQQLEKPQYHATLARTFAWHRLAPWLQRYLSAHDGVDVPGHLLVVGGRVAEAYSVCQPHNCGGSEIRVIFTPGGNQAWALFFDGAKRQFFGDPDGAMKVSLLSTRSK